MLVCGLVESSLQGTAGKEGGRGARRGKDRGVRGSVGLQLPPDASTMPSTATGHAQSSCPPPGGSSLAAPGYMTGLSVARRDCFLCQELAPSSGRDSQDKKEKKGKKAMKNPASPHRPSLSMPYRSLRQCSLEATSQLRKENGRSFRITRVVEWGCIRIALAILCLSLCVAGCLSPTPRQAQTPGVGVPWSGNEPPPLDQVLRDTVGCCWALGICKGCSMPHAGALPLIREAEQTSQH